MSERDHIPRVKVVVVGDGACGKTSLLTRFTSGTFTEVYVPTLFENQAKIIEYDGQPVELALWDTAGQEEYDKIRTLAYRDVDIILLLFSFDLPNSLVNVKERWIQEIRHHNGSVPVILVAAKSDLQNTLNAVGLDQAVDANVEINAVTFICCSALDGTNVSEVFDLAVKVSMESKKNTKQPKCINIKHCRIL